jgi:hypothetical protein
MNDLLALAAAVRESYLRAFFESLDAFLTRQADAATEVLFESPSDDALPFRVQRADMVADLDGTPQIEQVTPTAHLGFEPFGVELAEHLTVAMQPFVWNEVALRANITLPVEPVENWALHWLDLEGQMSPDEHGLLGVIHAVLREDDMDGSTLLTVDFGSAPVDALGQLLDLAFAAGATHVAIHSPSLQ